LQISNTLPRSIDIRQVLKQQYSS
jgi:tripartite-type tricarboxylate transporter receptor subunit TctC